VVEREREREKSPFFDEVSFLLVDFFVVGGGRWEGGRWKDRELKDGLNLT